MAGLHSRSTLDSEFSESEFEVWILRWQRATKATTHVLAPEKLIASDAINDK